MVFIDAVNNGYSVEQIEQYDRSSLTVGELIGVLEGYNTDEKVYLRFDRGYTFGSITYDKIDDDLDYDEE